MARWHASKVNFRQDMFVREHMKMNYADAAAAYLKVYKNTSKKCAAVRASVTLAKPHVRRRLYQLQERAMKRSDITIDKILTDYQLALDMAKGQGNSPAMVNAAQAQAKLVGLLRERVETGAVGEFGDTTSIEGILEVVAKEAGPEAAMVMASMFGINMPESATTKQMKEAALFISDPPTEAVN
jgi:hypothetical protein